MERREKVANFIKEETAKFLARTDNRTSLITVTNATCSPDLKRGTIFITVLPESKEEEVLHFVKRQLSNLRDYLKQHMETKVVPFLEVEIDRGEKHRQKIDELLRND